MIEIAFSFFSLIFLNPSESWFFIELNDFNQYEFIRIQPIIFRPKINPSSICQIQKQIESRFPNLAIPEIIIPKSGNILDDLSAYLLPASTNEDEIWDEAGQDDQIHCLKWK